MQYAVLVLRTAPVILLALFWCWESSRPLFGQGKDRVRHAAHNLALGLCNAAIVGVLFGTATVLFANWAAQNQFGLLAAAGLAPAARFALALLLLDGWMYVWHRTNHALPVLWRFHRVHHSDPHMDVTTATRFHLGEQVGAAALRLGLIPLVGFEAWNFVIYDTLVIAVTQFHHADISVGRLDRILRWIIVTPDMHKIHHSDWRPETDSNYSTVLSIWDRLAGTFRMRSDPRTVAFGLNQFRGAAWHEWRGMWKMPFANPDANNANVTTTSPTAKSQPI